MKRIGSMRKVVLPISVLGAAFVAISCVSNQANMTSVPEMERQGMERVGSVTTTFTSFQLFHTRTSAQRNAHARLMEEARLNFTGTFDVVNITIEGSFSPLQLLFIYPFFFVGNAQRITATGDVVMLRERAPTQAPQGDNEWRAPALQDTEGAAAFEL